MLLSQPCLLRGESLEKTQQEPQGGGGDPGEQHWGESAKGEFQEDRAMPSLYR